MAYGLVVKKVAIFPAAAIVTATKVAIAIINPAIETDLCSPIALVENVVVAIFSPVAWSPKIADFGSHDPRSWYPIIVVITVCPITRGPDVVIAGADGLLVDGQFGRRDPDG